MSSFADMQKAARSLQSLELPGSRTFAICYAGGSSVLIALGLVTLPANPFLAFGAAVAFIAVFCAAVVTVTPGATYLAIDADGVTRCLMFRKSHVEWKDVAAIRSDWFVAATFPVAWNKQVIVQSHNGVEGEGLSFFPFQFGCNAEEMIGLLTPYLENARQPAMQPREAVAA
jgi:hypothetical protein